MSCGHVTGLLPAHTHSQAELCANAGGQKQLLHQNQAGHFTFLSTQSGPVVLDQKINTFHTERAHRNSQLDLKSTAP
ncbi:hypothetical protein SKAU_G00339990 [Synaphobranchus kaupii]|uniref:Uncharacterized protein n=1 Tax=Synaphobranchus kaupii TaxID=118154 RepID=A0A9Q1EMT9_SYNKA|nr:hypothetical protein SKAU_G00339990 [Synaphobranchus kaupii]